MKRKWLILGGLLAFAIELLALVAFSLQTPDFSQDTVAVNEVVHAVKKKFPSLEGYEDGTLLDYVVLDAEGNLLYQTKSGLSESINEAISHRDTILDLEMEGDTVGKIIIYNDEAQTLRAHKQNIIFVLSAAIVLTGVLCAAYAFFLNRTIVMPFRKLKGFAERVAGGNLDIPLEMDRGNLFGAFTESFDLMRSELKKARLAEARAQKSKKELVAKLSHDIKTPVASIKAVSEVGLAVATKEKDRENYAQIIKKADQINVLVTNLFTATLEELQQLTVTPSNIKSEQVKTMLENADYLHRAVICDLPECLVYADGLRLQQVFDNLFANAYKYAKTEIVVTVQEGDSYLSIGMEDFGGGVPAEELPVLKEKFRRGSNAANTEGAGLGLFISDYFMKKMQGELKIENGAHGLKATVCLLLSGRI